VTVAIRLLQRDDVALLDCVAPGVFDHPINQRWSVEFFSDPRHHLVVAVDEKLVVGFASQGSAEICLRCCCDMERRSGAFRLGS
jgi:hypothetical protein